MLRNYRVVFIALGLSVLLLSTFKGEAMAELARGQLAPCPDTPNCVCSEIDMTSSAYISAFQFSDTAASAWVRLRRAIISSGGTIDSDDGVYIKSSYTSRWLRFVDDVEFSMNADQMLIQVRSASRVGRSDFGVNRKRVEMLRLLMHETN